MKYFLFLTALLFTVLACGPSSSADTAEDQSGPKATTYEPSFFELRTYYANPGKLNDLQKRFEDHTMVLFEKHGMTNIAYWLPIENEDNKLIYLMGYESKTQRDQAWEAFRSDPDWKAAFAASRENGPLVDSIENTFLTYTDYSPKLEIVDKSPRIFSLRTYYTNPGKLEALHQRFKNHTLEIFENNGMTNIAYFDIDEANPLSKNVLPYLITFPDTAARKASWASFSKDPVWQSAYQASIENGKLVDSIVVELMLPTPFSPLK